MQEGPDVRRESFEFDHVDELSEGVGHFCRTTEFWLYKVQIAPHVWRLFGSDTGQVQELLRSKATVKDCTVKLT